MSADILEVRKELLRCDEESTALNTKILALIKQSVFFITTGSNEVYAVTFPDYRRGAYQLEIARDIAMSRYRVRYSVDLENVLSGFVSAGKFSSLEDRLLRDDALKLEWTTREIARLDHLEDLLLAIEKPQSLKEWGLVIADILARPPGAFLLGQIRKWPPETPAGKRGGWSSL